ncbi:hypothetical protein BDF21DRAFT_454658 [Thamnidium elegans]|nr:hypothetical protein BDF21DRAFT_454658 [Thamnidium elegans]
MKQRIAKNIKNNAFKRALDVDRPRTRASIKQETDDSKEALRCTLYSPVKIESFPSELSEYEYNGSTKALGPSSKGIASRHCSLCNSTFATRHLYLDHVFHVHKTKLKPIIDLETLCCNICNKICRSFQSYRLHMATRNNINVPLKRKILKPDPSIIPDIKDPNHRCRSCDFTYKERKGYRNHLIKVHNMSHLRPSKEPQILGIKTPTFDILNIYCDSCDRKFYDKCRYLQHLNKIHKMIFPKSYYELTNFDFRKRSCKICETEYQNMNGFMRHLKNVHDVTPPPSSKADLIPSTVRGNKYCNVCDKSLYSAKVYLDHLAIIHTEKVPELYQGVDCTDPKGKGNVRKPYCADCQKIFLTKSFYLVHLEKIHDIKPVKSLPNADSPDINDPNNHCSTCDKKFGLRSTYRSHLSNVHRLILPFSRKKLNTSVETPIVDVLNKYCNVCNEKYEKMVCYRDHLRKIHRIHTSSTAEIAKPVNRNEMPLISQTTSYCTACDKIYKDKSGYRRHLRAIHGIKLPRLGYPPLIVNHDIKPDIDSKDNYCVACERHYSSGYGYRTHMKNIHNIRKISIKQEDTAKPCLN